MRTAFEPSGNVRSVDLLAAFATLWRERASGVVRFSAGGRAARFDVAEGELVAVSSTDGSFDAAEVLRRAEKLSPQALEEGRIPPGVDRARYLRDNGLLSDRDWRWGEKLRIVEILSDLVGWLDGAYQYDAEALPEPSDFRIGIHRVVLELYLRSSDRAFVHHSLGAPDAAIERGPDFTARFESLGLTPDALAVAAAIDGKSTAAEISRRVPPDPFSVEKLLAALATLGLVHPEYAFEEPPEPEPAAPPPPAEPAPEPRPEPAPELELEPLSEAEPESEVEAAAVAGAAIEPEPARPGGPPPYGPRSDEPEGDDLELLEMPSPPPLSLSEEPSRVELWDPAPPEPFDQPLDVVRPPEFATGSSRRISPVWLPLLLAAGVGALLLVRTRRPATPPLAPPPATAPAAATRGELPTAAPAVAAIATALPTPTFAPIPATPAPVPSARPSAPPPGPAALPRSREAWLALAERDRRLLASDRDTRFAIQLELVCELPSLDEAWVHDSGGRMWLLPASHEGRPCFRVFWGRYRNLEDARAGKSTVPAFFFTPTNRPVVVATGGALLR
jgi:hypothetical protein